MARPKKQPKPETQTPPAPAQEGDMARPPARAQYTVVTDRGPFWDGLPMPQGESIFASPDNAEIVTLIERGWIKESGYA